MWMHLEEISGFDRKMWFPMIQVEARFITDIGATPMAAHAVHPGKGILHEADRILNTEDITATVGKCRQIRCLEKMTLIRRWRKGGITDGTTGTTIITGPGRVGVQVEVEVAVIITKPKRIRKSAGVMSYISKR